MNDLSRNALAAIRSGARYLIYTLADGGSMDARGLDIPTIQLAISIYQAVDKLLEPPVASNPAGRPEK